MRFIISLFKGILARRGVEILALICAIIVLIFLQSRIWITHERMVTHDSINWFGIFYYFADSLYQGFLPLWNPYMNSGEPFFVNFYILRLLDPSTLILIAVGKFFNLEILSLYQYDLLLRYLIFVCSSYFLFKHITIRKSSAFLGFIILLFSSLSMSYLRQHGFLYACYLFPLCLLFLLKYLEKQEVGAFLLFLYFLGISALSYHFAFYAIALLVVILVLFLTKEFPIFSWPKLVSDRKWIMAGFVIFILLISNLFPAFAYFRQNMLPYARIFFTTPAYSFPADFLVLFSPYSLVFYFCQPTVRVSESFLYIGLLPLFFALVGLLFAKNRYKKTFVATLLFLPLLMMGQVFEILRNFFPFFSTIRNTSAFGPIFVFFLVCFACWGLDFFSEIVENAKLRFYRGKFLFLGLFIFVLSFLPFFFFKVILTNGNHVLLSSAFSLEEAATRQIVGMLFLAYKGIFLFCISFIILFGLCLRTGVSKFTRNVAIFFLILTDLFLFHSCEDSFFSTDRIRGAKEICFFSGKPIFKENRAFQMKSFNSVKNCYVMFGMPPLLTKEFTASLYYSGKFVYEEFNSIAQINHIFELKSYFFFLRDSAISLQIKEAIMGVSVPRLRLFQAVQVLPSGEALKRLENSDLKTAENVIFIEDRNRVSSLDRSEVYSVATTSLDLNLLGSHSVRDFSPNKLDVDVDLKENAFLYYADCFDEHWESYVDGQRQKIYKANAVFKALDLNKGRHSVQFVYNPRFYKFCLALYLLGNLGFVLLMLKLRSKKKKS